MEKIKVLIVDDERLARMELTRLLGKHEHVEIVAEAEDGQKAIELIQTLDVDLAFLDIQMPGINGLQVSKNIDAKFIFCTAFSEHAVDAFELNAVDYIMKPVDPLRLAQALEKFSNLPKKSISTPVGFLSSEHGVLLKLRDNYHLISLKSIFRFESVGNHVAVYFDDKKAYLHTSLSKVETRLDPLIYMKASRSDIVRIDAISKLEDGFNVGSMLVILEDGSEIPVSRRQAQLIKKRFSI